MKDRSLVTYFGAKSLQNLYGQQNGTANEVKQMSQNSVPLIERRLRAGII